MLSLGERAPPCVPARPCPVLSVTLVPGLWSCPRACLTTPPPQPLAYHLLPASA